MFRYEGYAYTFRWARHVYFLALLQKILGKELGEAPVVADIGSSYGIFSSLLKQELPRSHHILVDLPEHLLLAHYFLGCGFPRARIASPEILAQTLSISREVIDEYDFLLIPPGLFPRLARRTADLVTNFGSFGEMSRQYFEMYLGSTFFLSSRYLFTINRIAAVPAMYDNDMTILDYPIWDKKKKLHFGLCPVFSVDFLFKGHFKFFYSTEVPQPHFEYIGRT
jgi:putative sugar O-methyltransferase